MNLRFQNKVNAKKQFAKLNIARLKIDQIVASKVNNAGPHPMNSIVKPYWTINVVDKIRMS